MRRSANRLCVWTATALALCSTGKPAYCAEEQVPAGGEAPAEPPAAEPPAALPSSTPAAEVANAPTPTDKVRLQGERWKDIVVLPRRYVLKSRRVELMPMYQFNLSNPLMRNHGVGGQLNFFLSEALWLGLSGSYYFPQQSNGPTGTYFLIGAQDKVLPAVNKLVFSALLDFGYVPAHGKFALFNRHIMHWEGYVTAGVGAFMSEVVPVKPSDPAFKNISVIFDVGIGSRLFLTRWMALNAFLKLYGMPETFEPVNKAGYTRDGAGCQQYVKGTMPGSPEFEDGYATCRKENGNQTITFDAVFGLGLSFFLPPKFEYKLAR